ARKVDDGARAAYCGGVETEGPGVAGAELPAAMAAGATMEAQLGSFRWRCGEQRQHATAGVAVERGERPAQGFDPGRGVEIEQARLALPVGHRERYAVLIQAHAAHPECSARAKAAGRHLE